MSGAWAVLVREIRERRAIPLVGLALGFLPVIAGAVPVLTRIGGVDVRGDVALVLGLVFPTAVALGLGASVLGRDLAEQRLGFYFSRPVSGLGIWAGKMGAAILLIGASALLVSLPARFVSDEGFLTGVTAGIAAVARSLFGADGLLVPMGSQDPWVWRTAFAALVLCAAAAHAAVTMLRSRTGLLPLDLGLLIATFLALAAAAWRVLERGAIQMLAGLADALLWGLLAACLVAGAVQIAAGRSDRRRGHFLLSATLWGSLLVMVGGVHLCLSWAFAVTPADLAFSRYSGVSAAPQGDRFVVGGYSGGRLGYNPAFLVDSRSGAFVSLGIAELVGSVRFAADGRSALWVRYGPPRVLVAARWNRDETRLETVPLPPAGEYQLLLNLTSDGERALLLDSGHLTVVESSTGRIVAETTGLGVADGYFESSDVVRLESRVEGPGSVSEVHLLEWNLRSGQARETGRFGNAVSIGDRREGGLLVSTGDGGLEVRSATTGKLERNLLPPDAYRAEPRRRWSIQPRFLSAGRIAAIVRGADGVHLGLFPGVDAAGATADVKLPGRNAYLIGESTPGELMVDAWEESSSVTLLLDAASGAVRKREPGIQPAVWGWGNPSGVGAPGSLVARLFVTPDGALVNRDPATGALRVVVQGRRPAEN